ncbi:hypothetical protein QRX60_34725 [Amycolatopsis mongoliensis]|uniref:Uncharacterized protein n=1 Tax=Amycolatopsis mongoliensis TaxID=715475 RepID=A0A9Y2JIL1_9PSEU|nr:hypothetical protein [Amycolatopsis sp. 4-36]WIX99179.1 hypothetical protein QRX60_34725 [Amycolatopsis sp. 4-36]
MTERLYELLPSFVRARDFAVGEPLRALLAVITEQVDLVQDDIRQLYDNWFIETCQDWAVPYLGDLVGYRLLGGYQEALGARGTATAEAVARLAARLAPRRDVADTVANRRRKGTLPLLEEAAASVAEWPARAVEFLPLSAATQPVRLFAGGADAVTRRGLTAGGRLLDLRRGDLLDLAGSAFDPLAHGVAAPGIDSRRRPGRYAPQNVGLFVWRLRPYPVTHAPAYCIDRARNQYTFSILGNDVNLVHRPLPAPARGRPATEENLPLFLRRRAVRDRLADFYGPGKSFTIWRGPGVDPVPLSDIVVADLTHWAYRPRRHQVVVDPVLGRMVFGSRRVPRRGVWVTYHYAFSDDLGGGEYPRTLEPAPVTYRVGPGQDFERITSAYEQWKRDNADGSTPEAAIEITHSGAYQEQLEFVLEPGDRLQVRAADGTRPVLRLLDWYSNRPDSLQIRANECEEGDDRPPPRIVLDGLLVAGRGVSVTGPVGAVVVRHCTLVPGWSLEPHCGPSHPEEPSLVLENTTACVQVESSVLGTILVLADEVHADPLPIHLADSVLDATAPHREALSAPDCRHAHAVLHVHRSTVIGEVVTHAVALAENTIFHGRLRVARRGAGCVRFCYVPRGSRTPRRYHCEPDTAVAAVPPDERALVFARVRPSFTSTRYGTPGYAQLSAHCPPELARGAEDGSELGAFHDLFQPQRLDNLRARLAEFVPAGSAAAVITVS